MLVLLPHRGPRTLGFGPRSFSAAGPSAWNSLPSEPKNVSLTVGQFVHQLKTEMFVCSYYASAQPSQHCYKTCVKENTVTELNRTEPHLFLSVYVVISDFAARKQFLMEMEKSAAVMELYDAEFALASTFLQFLLYM